MTQELNNNQYVPLHVHTEYSLLDGAIRIKDYCKFAKENNITDVTPLGSLKELEYLELFSNKVTDITAMAGCESLVDLNIANNSISDFRPLTGLTHLRRLFIYNSAYGSNNGPVSNSIVSMLHSSLPGCRIDNATGGAHGAWREHHRYNTLLEMFWERENVPAKIHKYVPFKNLD